MSDISEKQLRRTANAIIKEHAWREDAIAMHEGVGEWLLGNGNVRGCLLMLEALTPAHEVLLETLAVDIITTLCLVRETAPQDVFADLIETHFTPEAWEERVNQFENHFDCQEAARINRELNEQAFKTHEGETT